MSYIFEAQDGNFNLEYEGDALGEVNQEWQEEYNDLRGLWRAVILRALSDIKLKPSHKKNRSARRKAIRWLDINDQGFLEVCHLAEFDPKKVLEKAQSD